MTAYFPDSNPVNRYILTFFEENEEHNENDKYIGPPQSVSELSECLEKILADSPLSFKIQEKADQYLVSLK